ncbi:MAG: AzlC family ABC transporter permease [Pontimonas sp.]|nr:AzlC family ABC transporter permease [Pontimonas sp.]
MTEEFQDAHNRRARAQGFQVALAVSLNGISFGALSVALGFSVWQTMVLSLLMFSGASQIAFIGIIGTGGVAAAGAAIASAGLLGLRNGLYALRMSPIIGPGFWKRALAGHLTVDESTAVAVAQTDQESARHGFWTTALVLYAGWNLTTLVGALAGDALGDVRTWGLDAMAAAAFLGLLWPRLASKEPIAVAIAAAAVTVVLIPVVPPGIPVLAAATVGIALAIYRHRVAPHAPSRAEGADS